eukprot:g48.t1
MCTQLQQLDLLSCFTGARTRGATLEDKVQPWAGVAAVGAAAEGLRGLADDVIRIKARTMSGTLRRRAKLRTGRSGSGGNHGRPRWYRLDLLPGRRQDPYPTFDLLVEEDGKEDGKEVVPHVCSKPGEAYVIRVTNSSRRHIACAVTVDGENALLKDGSLIVAPKDARELQGYLVSKNFIGKEYEYRDFLFSTPKVIEAQKGDESEIPYTTYGRIVCEVYEAVLDEEVDSDQELRGQTTQLGRCNQGHYRGAGLHGSSEQRVVPEGKRKHFMYSAVTVQGARSTIANSTRGRWWVRGQRKIRTKTGWSVTIRHLLRLLRMASTDSMRDLFDDLLESMSASHETSHGDALSRRWVCRAKTVAGIFAATLATALAGTASRGRDGETGLRVLVLNPGGWQIGFDCPKQVVGFDLISSKMFRFNSANAARLDVATREESTKRSTAGSFQFTDGHEDLISGRPCGTDVHNYWWPEQDSDLYNLPMPHEVPFVDAPRCNVPLSRWDCQSTVNRPFLPWPLNQVHQQQGSECCSPVERPQAISCRSGWALRSGQNCNGLDAGDFGCCPDDQVQGRERNEMHCVMLFRPWTYEQSLIEIQYRKKAGIFQCDSYALYSNEVIELFPGVVSRRIHSPLMCEIGGQFITALNLGIFLTFYRQVILDADFMDSAWVIKVDPDTVWNPQRLRPLLDGLSWGLDGDGIYLNNCELGFHGPIDAGPDVLFFVSPDGARETACGSGALR